MFATSHHKQPSPLENEEKDITLSNKRVLLEFKKSMEVQGKCMEMEGEFA